MSEQNWAFDALGGTNIFCAHPATQQSMRRATVTDRPLDALRLAVSPYAVRRDNLRRGMVKQTVAPQWLSVASVARSRNISAHSGTGGRRTWAHRAEMACNFV